jgi:serine/threonine-protein kinase
MTTPPEPDSVLATGELVGGCYRVERELGRGAMGVVYLARDEWLNRMTALKIVAPAWARSLAAEPLLRQEAQALASLRNEHVVQIYAFGPHAGSYFFAMEHVRGQSLAHILWTYKQHGSALPLHSALTLLERIAAGLDAVHAAGHIHRDVKPSNILIEDDTGRPVLIDFGLAAPGRPSQRTFAGGTPRYMPPEQAGTSDEEVSIGPWSDAYALACTAFEMLAGRAPFDEEDPTRLLWLHAVAPPPRVSLYRRDLCALDGVLLRALAKSPQDRYPRCTAMIADLVAAVSQERKSLRPPAPREAPPSDGNDTLSVLCVDDDPNFRKFVLKAAELALQGRSLRVATAGSGEEALACARTSPPDIVLLDFDMPGLDGVDTLSHLRALPQGSRARVVVLSGRLGPQDRWRFSVLGVKDFVGKPIDLRLLVAAIGDIAARVKPSLQEMPTHPRS